MAALAEALRPAAEGRSTRRPPACDRPRRCEEGHRAPRRRGRLRASRRARRASHAEPLRRKRIAAQRIARDVLDRVTAMTDLGLGYLSLERATPTLSPASCSGCGSRRRSRSNLFGVVYVLDEPSAGLHPADGEALLVALDRLVRPPATPLFVVEHDLDVIRRADWIVDVGPDAGEHGGKILYSGPPPGLRDVTGSHTARYLFAPSPHRSTAPRTPKGWLTLVDVTRNNLHGVAADVPIGVLTSSPGSRDRASRASSVRRWSIWCRRIWVDRRRPPTMPVTKRETPRAAFSTTRRRRPKDASRAALDAIRRLVVVTRSRSVARRARTSRPTPACSTRCASCSRRPPLRGSIATTRAASRSTSRRVVARPAKAKASSRSSCCSWRASMRRARPATARATTRRRCRSRGATGTSPRCSA